MGTSLYGSAVIIEVLPSQKEIPDFNWMEQNVMEHDTVGYICDDSGKLLTFTKHNGEIICGSYDQDISTAKLLEEIEQAVEEEGDAVTDDKA